MGCFVFLYARNKQKEITYDEEKMSLVMKCVKYLGVSLKE